MKTTITFAPNTDFNTDNEFVVIAKGGPEEFPIEFKVAEGPDWNRHQIIIANGEALDLPHYTIARIVLEASLMIDSHFQEDETVEPYNEKTFEA
jgi:hypothetical protein